MSACIDQNLVKVARICIVSTFLVCFILVVSLALSGVAHAASGDLIWQKNYASNCGASSMQQTSDGGYIVVGSTNVNNAIDQKVDLVKLNANYTTEWEYSYGPGYGSGSSVQQTSDGGYIIGGSLGGSIGTCQVYLVKVNANGMVEWQNNYGGDGDHTCAWVQQTSDGGYIITGSSIHYNSGNITWYAYLLKVKSDGTTEWENDYGEPVDGYNYSYCFGNSVQQTSDGGYIITGSSMPSEKIGGQVYLVKVTADGTMEWENDYGEGVGNGGNSVLQTSDGGYIITGYTWPTDNYFHPYLVKVSSDGTMEWQNTCPGSDGSGYSVKQTSDGGYIITGSTGENGLTPASLIYLAKFKPNGMMDWQNTYIPNNDSDPGTGGMYDAGKGVSGAAGH